MRKSFFAGLALAAVTFVGAGCTSQTSVNSDVTANVNQPAVDVNSSADADAGGTTPSMDMRIAGNAIIIGSQRPSSDLKAELIEADKPVFVVVREGNYQNGTIIGQTGLQPKGSSNNVTITLIRPSVHGETLYVVAYADNGNGVFDTEDSVLLGYSGDALYSTVEIDKDASEDPLLPRI